MSDDAGGLRAAASGVEPAREHLRNALQLLRGLDTNHYAAVLGDDAVLVLSLQAIERRITLALAQLERGNR